MKKSGFSDHKRTEYRIPVLILILFFSIVTLIAPVNALDAITPVLSQDLQISTLNGAWYQSDAAFDGTNYFVAWFGINGNHGFVKGQFINPNGELVGNPFIIAENLHNTYRVSTAFNGVKYLVVYVNMESNDAIFGTIVDPLGNIGPTTRISTENAGNSRSEPDVASDGTDFLVVWVDNRQYSSNYGDIYGQRISASGNLIGTNFLVSPTQKAQMAPSVAYDGNYFVVWSEENVPNSNGNDVYGRRISPDGQLLDSTPLLIAAGPSTQGKTGIAISPGPSGFLVTWRDVTFQPSSYQIRGARVSHDGTLIDGPEGSAGFLVLKDCGSVASAFDGTNWLIVSDTYTIRAVRVSEDSSILDPGVKIQKSGGIFWNPSIAFGNSNYLVVYSSEPNGGTTIFGQIVEIKSQPISRPPVLASIPVQSVNEGQPLTFQISATQPDNLPVTVTATGLPDGSQFSGTTFTWTPTFAQAGQYSINFTATAAGLNANQTVTITVNNVNQIPILAPIGPKSVDEGHLLTFKISGSDPDGTALTYSVSTLEAGATFDPATQTFAWTPGFDKSGDYPVTFTISDGTLTAAETITITVNNVNQPPVLTAIGSKSVDEGHLLTFKISGSDPDGTALTYSVSTLEAGATFDPATQTFAWTPGFDKSGDYPVTFTISDGTLTAAETVTITVDNVNRPPVFVPIPDQSVNEGQTLTFTVTANQQDNQQVVVTATGAPNGAQFSGTSFTWTPSYDQSGSYSVTFTATSMGLSVSQPVQITVNNVNQPPILNPIGSKFVDEGQSLTFKISGSDPDGTALTYSTSALESGATFDPATQTFTWTPGFDKARDYPVTFALSDGKLTAAETVTITVKDVNRPPVLTAIGSKSVDEGQLLNFKISGSDPDGTALTYSVSTLEAGATFDPATQTFAWTPSYVQSGSYTVTFTVSDGKLTAAETVTITVKDVNRPPVLTAIGSKSVDEGQLLNFKISGSDPDGTALTYSVSTLEIGATFDPATQTFTWTPGFDKSGKYPVTFTLSDGKLTAAETVTITVNNVNQKPTAEAGTPVTALVREPVAFNGSLSNDPDGSIASFAWNYGDNYTGSGLTQAHSFTTPGTFVATLTVMDNEGATGTDTMTVTVKSSGQAIQDTIAQVKAMNLPKGTDTSLISKLDNAVKSLEKGNANPAKNQIEATINEINAQRMKKISGAQADLLVPALEKIILYL